MNTYMSFDEVRKSDKRIGYKNIPDAWFELDELFQYLGDVVSKDDINKMLDSSDWMVEQC